MSEATWLGVDHYLSDLLVAPDAALTGTLEASAVAGLPEIHVAPNQGKLLHLLARMQGARRILELGTLGGYSTIWLARALPPGGRWSRWNPRRSMRRWRGPISCGPAWRAW